MKFKYLKIVVTSDEWPNNEVDAQIGTANAVLLAIYRSVVT